MKWQPDDVRVEFAITKTAEMRRSTKPHWHDVRQRLDELGIAYEDAVVAEWQPEGEHFMFGLVASRDGRLFIFDATFDFDPSGRPLAKGIGWIGRWRELGPEEARLTSAGYPNSYSQSAIVGRLVFAREHGAGTGGLTSD